ncbi:SDR family NAD(P)-dependent oxidoreductase [Paramicrobacterium agarici]|uniref:NAD(P)-dependent dehydrogenase (Short-subunit alcohol dehydrogenase family) n=1 Tax=Paramicrobacterium agarici TaxID=630514 RepID=A0A2A9DUJ6_9MICO|nr:SDR family NAD(P)-dependent oxidoreductase [Microbacterium agarici]PFG30036.1 NAD(P)-dependent dehydrogenase (short-subunit alcohol dehydrogenase family) [Microbacterium agarici]
MPQNSTPLSSQSTIGEWLAHPAGGPVLRAVLAESGQTADALRPVRSMPLERMVELSKGAFPAELVTELVRRIEAGEIPEEDAATASSSEPAVDEPAVPIPAWSERITEGRFAGKTIIVTGAGSGIGKATASRIAREGGRVIAVDIAADRLDGLVAELPDADIVAVGADIADDADVQSIVAAAGDTIDGLANIAGIMDDMTPVGELTDAVWQRVFRVNVDGTMKLMRAVVPHMLPRATGTIVNIASEAGLRGSAAGAAYTASKHAVIGLTKSSAYMYGPLGLRINAVAPGGVITNIEARFASPLGEARMRKGMAVMTDAVEASALAASITFLLSDDGVNLNGVVLPSDGGWSAA